VRLIEPKTDRIVKIPVICVRSFFNRAFSQRHKTHRAWSMAAMTLALVLILTVVLLNTQTGFAVYLNGEPIGRAKSMEDVTAIVTGAEEQLKDIFGHDYSLDRSISVSPDLGVKADDTENIKNAIVGGIDGVTKMYVLEVNGKAVGAADNAKALDDILSSILNEYSTAQTSSVKFTDTVTVNYRFVSNDITQDTALIKTMLEPSNTASLFKLTVENTEQKQYTKEVPYYVQHYNDDTVYEGNSVIKTAGAAGENLITENTVYVNGSAQLSQIISTIMTKSPVTEIIADGTALRPKTASYGKYIWPAAGIITSPFGHRTGFGSSNHQGIDIAGSYGEEITAADGGEVIKADWSSGYGLLVEIQHDDGDVTYYGHCSELLVKEGDRVYQGQVIAHMGATGDANGIHCHFEIRVNGSPVNPIKYLPK
jgi:murein DD-endopeptidase MepM/ murein hydrolase activator NlpD